MSQYEVVLKQVAAQRVAAIRDVLPAYADVSRLFGELFGFLGQSRVAPAGPPCTTYHDPEHRERDVDAEVAVPIAAALPEHGRVKVKELPGATVASVLHHGDYQSIGPAYGALMQWIGANGYRAAGPGREVYVRGAGPGVDPQTYVTEVQFPVEKA